MILCCLCGQAVFAQYAYFGKRGIISFDKIIYTKAQMRQLSNDISSKMMDRGIGMMEHLDKMPDSHTEKLNLFFDENATLLVQQEKEGEDKQAPASRSRSPQTMTGRGRGARNPAASQGPARQSGMLRRGNMKNDKILYQDLKARKANIQLNLDDKYLLTETLDSITWRFTEEFRNIAGINCRRVNGATKDSLYLVAYYAEEIPVSAGPALSHGLPGMILGLAIPEMHMQYWATKIDYTNNLIPTDWEDKKAKKMELDEFSALFGRYMPRNRQNESAKKRILEQLVY